MRLFTPSVTECCTQPMPEILLSGKVQAAHIYTSGPANSGPQLRPDLSRAVGLPSWQ